MSTCSFASVHALFHAQALASTCECTSAHMNTHAQGARRTCPNSAVLNPCQHPDAAQLRSAARARSLARTHAHTARTAFTARTARTRTCTCACPHMLGSVRAWKQGTGRCLHSKYRGACTECRPCRVRACKLVCVFGTCVHACVRVCLHLCTRVMHVRVHTHIGGTAHVSELGCFQSVRA